MNILACLLLASSAPAQGPVYIGTHYTDALSGLVVYRNAKESVLLNIQWRDSDGKLHQGYNDLSNAKLRFGEAAPNDSYHRISWEVGKNVVTYEWGLIDGQKAFGRIRSTGEVEVQLQLSGAWPLSHPAFTGTAEEAIEHTPNLDVRLKVDGRLVSRGEANKDWTRAYRVGPKAPVDFSIGVGPMPDPRKAEVALTTARSSYLKTRLWSEGDWGGFVDPIQNQMGNSKVYSIETGRLAQIVSRRWCLPDGQVLFCWDSFFNGLLSSLEDTAGARQTVRAALNGVTPDGFVPNFSGRGWGSSFDRSQPCVGAMCVWKIHQRSPDTEFLKETYPKLLRWHRWWLPNRDGNHDGLLEWGTRTKDLQNAKFESGLDDSPMFDDAKMVGTQMNVDSTDLSALYAMDAEYLARIADTIGKHSEAKSLRADRDAMVARVNKKLWNDAMNSYSYRYWTPNKPTIPLSISKVITADGQPGLKGEYFQGRALEGEPIIRQDKDVNFNWENGPIAGIGKLNYSVRWTGHFHADSSDDYAFHVSSDDGSRLYIDDKLIIDDWAIHPSTKVESKPIHMVAGSTHKLRLEYFQAEGGAEVRLELLKIKTSGPGQVFYTRLSPLNYYPLIVEAPSKAKGQSILRDFFLPTKFGGNEVCPTISRDDPAFPAQGYWRGTVWGPTSYLTNLGIKNYASDQQLTEYAEKSVRLFMITWLVDGTCRENFNITTYHSSSDPHYTWGALMCLLGLESLCDIEPDGRVKLNGDSGKRIAVHNLRLKGRIYDLRIEPRRARLIRNGKVVATVTGKIGHVRL